MNQAPYFPILARELGVHEIAGPGDEPRIVFYHSFTDGPGGDQDETAWCSSAMNYAVQVAGMKGTRSKAARSWTKWGVAVADGEWMSGDICVLWRVSPESGFGHVGILVCWDKDYVWLLAGNQGDRVSIARFERSRVLKDGVRRAVAIPAAA